MTVTSIYDAYVPTQTSRKDKRETIYNHVVDLFRSECERLDADTADDIEMAIFENQTQNLWEPVKKDMKKFENQTKLTIFESTLMTLKRRDKIIADRAAALLLLPPAPAIQQAEIVEDEVTDG